MAAATVTLSTTTLLARSAAGDTQVLLASLTGVAPGVALFVDQELMKVVGPTGVSTLVTVLRGRDGTVTQPHGSGATVTIGRPDQFYESDPVGTPPSPPAVLPYINVRNGTVWAPVGDETGPSQDARQWQKQTTVTSAGALGVNVNTTQGEV